MPNRSLVDGIPSISDVNSSTQNLIRPSDAGPKTARVRETLKICVLKSRYFEAPDPNWESFHG